MHNNLQQFTELFALGMNPIPVIWDIENRQVSKYPLHETDVTDGKPHLQDIERWLKNGFKDFNGIALKLYPPFGMFDFDLKNTENKNIYKEWFNIIANTNPDVLNKVCIETTRSGGYHVYIKYEKLSHKIPVARSIEGDEVISVYTGGLLSFCAPSPHYEIIHGDFASLGLLTDDEFELLLSSAAFFNEDKEHEVGKTKVAVIDYPTEYENICIQFDNKCTDELFDTILNNIDLYKVDKKQYGRKKWIPYLREGSNAEYSAKAYFYSKRLLIFSASMRDFPTWHDSAKTGDNTWSLSPSKILFYKNKRSWSNTIEEIQGICESVGIELVKQIPVTQQPLINEDRLKFPYDIFPDCITNYISFSKIQNEYIAGALLPAITTAIGNVGVLKALDNYFVKPILYIAVVSHSGGGKSPAIGIAFSALKEHQSMLTKRYEAQKDEHAKEMAFWEKNKKEGEKPKDPNLKQLIIYDSTIEMVVKILSINEKGCCLVADELIGFLNRMNQYKAGDDVQKWLELWNGNQIMIQRVSREADIVNEPICNIFGGIQISLLGELSKNANEYNGFFHRFLFCYPTPEPKPDWGQIPMPDIVREEFNNYFIRLLQMRDDDKVTYKMSTDAELLYSQWYNYKNKKYNTTKSDQVRGIIAKYQDYCLRFALIIQLMHELDRRSGVISSIAMEKAIRLTEYFFGNMYKAVPVLTPESPIDSLKNPYNELYVALPNSFTLKVAIETGKNLNIKEGSVKTFIYRKGKDIFKKRPDDTYEKLY